MFDKYVGSTIQLFAKINLALYVIAGFIFLIWAAVTGAILGVILTIAVPLSGTVFFISHLRVWSVGRKFTDSCRKRGNT